MCTAQCVHPAVVQPKHVFRSVRWCTILLESPSVLTTLGSDIRQQSFTNNTFSVIRAVYFCSQFNENNASFARTWDANRNHHVMHLTRLETQIPKGVTFLAHTVHYFYIKIFTKIVEIMLHWIHQKLAASAPFNLQRLRQHKTSSSTRFSTTVIEPFSYWHVYLFW